MTEEEEARRGREAELLLENPLFVEAFATIAQEYEQAWRDSPSRDEKGREKLWLMVKLLDRVKVHVQQVAFTGQMARKTIRERVGRVPYPL